MTCPRCGKDNPAPVHTCTPNAAKFAYWLEAMHPGNKASAELRRLSAQVDEDEALLQQALDVLLCIGDPDCPHRMDQLNLIAALIGRLEEAT
jgi:hypothetical protein